MSPFQEMSDFLSQKGTRVDIIAEGILPAKSRLVVAASPKVGKTKLVTQMALELVSGTPFLGLFDIPRPVACMIAELEVDEDSYRERLEAARSTVHGIPQNYLFVGGPQPLLIDTPQGSAELVKQITALQPKVVILDPLYNLHTQDEDKASGIKPVLMFLDKLVRDFGISFIVVHHSKKAYTDNKGHRIDQGMDAIRGSNALYGWADSVLVMDQIPGQENILLRFWMRHGAIEPIVLTPVKDKFTYTAQPRGQPTSPDEQAIIGILKVAKSNVLSYQSIIAGTKAQTKHSDSTIRQALASLRKKGLIAQSGQGRSQRRVFLLNEATSGWFLLD